MLSTVKKKSKDDFLLHCSSGKKEMIEVAGQQPEKDAVAKQLNDLFKTEAIADNQIINNDNRINQGNIIIANYIISCNG